jgi:hypothetical protein
MLMKGDINKVLAEVNVILEGAFKRIEALEDRLAQLETPVVAEVAPKRGPGRPPGAKNKDKLAA